jgi:hypothetical protein
MYDTYTHTETCTQSFKDHLRAHLAARKQSLGSGDTFIGTTTTGTGTGVPVNSNMSSAETLKPVDVPNCVCGSPVKNESEKVPGKACDCARRVTVIDDNGFDGELPVEKEAPVLPEKKKSFKSKALDILCSACTGYVAKPRAGGFYPDAE